LRRVGDRAVGVGAGALQVVAEQRVAAGLELRLGVFRILVRGLFEVAGSTKKVVLLLGDQAQEVAAHGVRGIDLQGVAKLKRGLHVVTFGIERFSLAKIARLGLRLGLAAAEERDGENDRQRVQEARPHGAVARRPRSGAPRRDPRVGAAHAIGAVHDRFLCQATAPRPVAANWRLFIFEPQAGAHWSSH